MKRGYHIHLCRIAQQDRRAHPYIAFVFLIVLVLDGDVRVQACSPWFWWPGFDFWHSVSRLLYPPAFKCLTSIFPSLPQHFTPQQDGDERWRKMMLTFSMLVFKPLSYLPFDFSSLPWVPSAVCGIIAVSSAKRKWDRRDTIHFKGSSYNRRRPASFGAWAKRIGRWYSRIGAGNFCDV